MGSAPKIGVTCDVASLMEFDNGRKLLQFVDKKSSTMPPGFAGGELKLVGDKWTLVVDRVYPPRRLGGKSSNQIMKEARTTVVPAEGFCFFSDPDYKKTTQLSCVAKTERGAEKTIYSVVFNVSEVSEKRDLGGEKTASKTKGDFERIFQYTMMDKTLPDGKHPVWVYYQAKDNIVRVDMPSMDMCVVTDESVPDRQLINARRYEEIRKNSSDWQFAQDIWKAAFQRYMIVGKPRAC